MNNVWDFGMYMVSLFQSFALGETLICIINPLFRQIWEN